jgi:hypothetical protein
MGVEGLSAAPEVVPAGRVFLAVQPCARLIWSMGTRTTFVCDCCFRESDNNLGWARVSVNGASDGKQLMPDDNRDLCEICWSPLQTLMKKVHDEAREKRNTSEADPGKK